jgi:predicted DNA-binding transcriptional regulator AlpA
MSSTAAKLDEVLEELRQLREELARRPAATPTRIGTAEAARLLGVSRNTLDAMIDSAPRTLPGAPVNVGTKKRRSLRWDPTKLDEWAQAYRDWSAGRRRSSTRTSTPATKKPTPTPSPTKASTSALPMTPTLASPPKPRKPRSLLAQVLED